MVREFWYELTFLAGPFIDAWATVKMFFPSPLLPAASVQVTFTKCGGVPGRRKVMVWKCLPAFISEIHDAVKSPLPPLQTPSNCNSFSTIAWGVALLMQYCGYLDCEDRGGVVAFAPATRAKQSCQSGYGYGAGFMSCMVCLSLKVESYSKAEGIGNQPNNPEYRILTHPQAHILAHCDPRFGSRNGRIFSRVIWFLGVSAAVSARPYPTAGLNRWLPVMDALMDALIGTIACGAVLYKNISCSAHPQGI
ncbi:MAG: hypothetical protein IPH35_18305 [Rhodoferax sp.]|nr:hypothetical protein [Rhodoferax sp.]